MKKHILLIVLSLITFVLTAQWIQQTSGTNKDLNGVCFTENGFGWIVVENGTILHTDYTPLCAFVMHSVRLSG